MQTFENLLLQNYSTGFLDIANRDGYCHQKVYCDVLRLTGLYCDTYSQYIGAV